MGLIGTEGDIGDVQCCCTDVCIDRSKYHAGGRGCLNCFSFRCMRFLIAVLSDIIKKRIVLFVKLISVNRKQKLKAQDKS